MTKQAEKELKYVKGFSMEHMSTGKEVGASLARQRRILTSNVDYYRELAADQETLGVDLLKEAQPTKRAKAAAMRKAARYFLVSQHYSRIADVFRDTAAACVMDKKQLSKLTKLINKNRV